MKVEQADREPRAIVPCCLVLVMAALSLPPTLRGQDESIEAGAVLREKAEKIRTSADKLFKLRRIPWITDPAEGFRLAREENRPVFLYMQAGDPLEDC